MSLDDQTDTPLSAVAALVRGAITTDLGADFLSSVYDDPRALTILTSGKLPALCVYRASEQWRRRNSTALVHDITVQFDYVLQPTSLEKRGGRWPALSATWNCLANAVLDGKHPAVSSGAAVLEAAGLFVEQEKSAHVTYGVADGGGENYPILRGSIVATFTPSEVDIATLNDFLQFHMSFDKPVGSPPDGESLIDLDVTLPPFGS